MTMPPDTNPADIITPVKHCGHEGCTKDAQYEVIPQGFGDGGDQYACDTHVGDFLAAKGADIRSVYWEVWPLWWQT